jgi:hypothetical protein
MSEHRPDTDLRRDAAAVAAIAEVLDRLGRPGCLPPARFWQLASGVECPADELRHLLGCGRCRGYTARVAAALEGSPEPPGWASLNARARVAAVRTRLARQPLLAQGRQRLTFADDPHLSAVCGLDPAGVRWLELEHRLLPPGIPFLVLLDGGGAGLGWRRLVLLREGQHNASVRVRLGASLPGRRLRVGRTDLEDVTALPDPEDLRDSFTAAAQDDPAALPHWRAWAREALTQTGLTAGVGCLLEDIARGCIRI